MIDLASARVVITIGGAKYTVDGKTGKDLGDFVSDIGGFTQKNIAVLLDPLRMTIFFRPDTTSDRFEVVFELGRADDPAPANLGAYTAAILLGTTVLRSIDVAQHYWFSRWRWQSDVRPPVRKVSEIPAGLLPPMRDVKKVKPTPAPPLNTGVVFDIMGLAGITPYMPQTGERADIGLVTEVQGRWMDAYAPADYALMMQQAEASASIPWHIREPSTLSVYDSDAHPTATLYGQKPGQWEYIAQAPNPVTIDIAHEPDLCYLPYLLTGDPYFLEEMQFAANQAALAQPPDMRLMVVQTRAYAWMLRNVSHCAAVTPASAPGWVTSKSKWAARLEAHRTYFTAGYVNATDPVRAVLRTADDYANSHDEGPTNPQGTHVAPWQDEFMGCVFAWIVDLGFAAWRPVFDWQIASTIARTSGSSGWPKEVATPYRMNVCAVADGPLAKAWAEAWTYTKTLQGYTIPVPGQSVPGSDTWYLTYTRGALAYALKAGYDVGAVLAWIDGELHRLGVTLAGQRAKWALLPA